MPTLLSSFNNFDDAASTTNDPRSVELESSEDTISCASSTSPSPINVSPPKSAAVGAIGNTAASEKVLEISCKILCFFKIAPAEVEIGRRCKINSQNSGLHRALALKNNHKLQIIPGGNMKRKDVSYSDAPALSSSRSLCTTHSSNHSSFCGK